MSAKYEVLIRAGAPRLPEGYYYKIDAGINSRERCLIWVRVVRKRTWWFDKRLSLIANYASEVTNVEGVAKLCAHAWTKASVSPLPDTLRPILGRHP